MPQFVRAIHIALTVRDLRRSAAWYRQVLGFNTVKEFTFEPDEPGIPRMLLLHSGSRFLVALCEHRDRSGDAFDPIRTGLDHLALEVAGRDELEAWTPHLEQLGVTYSPIKDLGHASYICVKDPDGIPIELWHATSLVPAH
jgi:catechol 2,3-dioxygenase-like lactoylglutathione lyase family enzyme